MTDLFAGTAHAAPDPASGPKRWWPLAYADEWMPAPRVSPDAWLVYDTSGAPCLDAGDPDNPESAWGKPLRLAFGDDTAFYWVVPLGQVTVTVAADGAWKGGPVNPAANSFWEVGDGESGADSMDEFARYWAENEGLRGDATEDVTVSQAMIGDCILVLAPKDGKATFIAADAEAQAPGRDGLAGGGTDATAAADGGLAGGAGRGGL